MERTLCKYVIIAVVLLILPLSTMGQNNYENQRFIPPTPLAESFKIYGDIPVSYNTGVPDISIPLYTIQVGNYVLPITLRYHVKSLKPSSCRNSIALGWSLDYGGMVSRSIYDRPDDGNVNVYNPAYDPMNSDYLSHGEGSNTELYDMWKVNGSDSEYDIYNYSIPGASGEFLANSGNEYLMSKHPVRINCDGNDIDITDDKGVVYKFGYGNHHATDNPAVNFEKSSWLLTQIDLPSNKSIDFSYEPIARFTEFPHARSHTLQGDHLLAEHHAFPRLMSEQPYPSPIVQINYNEYPEWTIYDEKNIKEITFPNGKVTFTLSADKKLITGLTISNARGVLKQFEFVLSSSPVMDEMKLLTGIIVKDKAANIVNEYQFQYEPGYFIPKDAGTDWWGYYNGSPLQSFPCDTYSYTSGPLLETAPYSVTGYCQSKTADESSALDHSLKKIIYPTKGETEFVFKLNQINSTTKGDGLRVEKIISRDGYGEGMTRSYVYENPISAYVPLGKNDVSTVSYYIRDWDMGELGGYSILQSKNITYESSVSSRAAAHLLATRYGKVTEIIGDESSNIGRNVYFYNANNDHEIMFTDRFAIKKYRDWDNCMLSSKEVYRANETTPLTTENYQYIYHYDATPFKNTYVSKKSNYDGVPEDNGSTRQFLISHGIDLVPHVYTYTNYDIVTGWVELKNEIRTTRTAESLMTTTIDYEYSGAEKYYPSKIISNNSDGTITHLARQYVYDFGSATPYSLMISDNNISPVITESETVIKGSTTSVLRSSLTNFQDWGTTIMPANVRKSTAGLSLEDRIVFDKYDQYGNVLQYHKSNDIYKSYVWDASGVYPVAEVLNAEAKDIFYHSFEDAGGNSIDGDSKTGNKSVTNGYSDLLTNLTNGEYQLSYWSKLANVWSYQLSFVTVTNGSFLISLTGQVDEVRFHPKNSVMTTYAYNPGVGITSVTDANNVTVYYEYDEMSRLKLIKDDKGSILKKYTYHYANE